MNSRIAWEHQSALSATAAKTIEPPIPIIRLAAMLLTHLTSSQVSGHDWAPLVVARPGCGSSFDASHYSLGQTSLDPESKPVSRSSTITRKADAMPLERVVPDCLLFRTGNLPPCSSISPLTCGPPGSTSLSDASTGKDHTPTSLSFTRRTLWSVCPSQRVSGQSMHPRHYSSLPILLLTSPARRCRNTLLEEACSVAALGRRLLFVHDNLIAGSAWHILMTTSQP